ncbi:hypothetical protein RvY_13615-3 [Ramazzottius varieornatus]|uniref:Uncharacterized protein n=1 Tax=Ramazzottius varieornatus TaxID=947166 RepID=A0A1D1VVX9_RAMVA|nr:hypothetical protein RvY_13615-3 [Ramazzottius varieornatus]
MSRISSNPVFDTLIPSAAQNAMSQLQAFLPVKHSSVQSRRKIRGKPYALCRLRPRIQHASSVSEWKSSVKKLCLEFAPPVVAVITNFDRRDDRLFGNLH